MGHQTSQERYKYPAFPGWSQEGSFGRANQTFATKYDTVGNNKNDNIRNGAVATAPELLITKKISSDYYPAYPYCDMETPTQQMYVDYDGTWYGGAIYVIDPTKISTRSMPIAGGMTHEVELGMISRGKAWQTLNLTEYNLSDINQNHYNGDPQKSQYIAQYARSFIDDQRGISFHNPVGNVNTSDNSDMPTCDGGDRQLLDDVYISAAGTLNDLSQEKIVYGKMNINSVRLGALKVILQSFNIPSSGDEAPNSETTVLKDDNVSSPTARNASGIIDRLNDVNLVHFMTKYTYDKTQAVSATNSPNDPMRWGSKRLGTLFALRAHENPHDAALPAAEKEAYFKREVGEAEITDRQKETLLLKLKDFTSVRYTQYSGLIIAESMLYNQSNLNGFNKVTDAVAAYDTQVARPILYGKTLSQRQYRIEIAYDHFLDKIVVLDYKYMGKLN